MRELYKKWDIKKISGYFPKPFRSYRYIKVWANISDYTRNTGVKKQWVLKQHRLQIKLI